MQIPLMAVYLILTGNIVYCSNDFDCKKGKRKSLFCFQKYTKTDNFYFFMSEECGSEEDDGFKACKMPAKIEDSSRNDAEFKIKCCFSSHYLINYQWFIDGHKVEADFKNGILLFSKDSLGALYLSFSGDNDAGAIFKKTFVNVTCTAITGSKKRSHSSCLSK